MSDIGPLDGATYAAKLHQAGELKRQASASPEIVGAGYRIVDGTVLMEDDGSLILRDASWPIANRTAWHLTPESQSFRIEAIAYAPPAMSGPVVADGNKTSVEVPLGFSFPIGGASYPTAWVSANGCISFGKPAQWDNGWGIDEARAVLDSSPRLCPAFSERIWLTHLRTEPGRAVFWWEGGPNGTYQVVLTSTGEAYFYYADPPSGASIMIVTGLEPWWTSGRIFAQTSFPAGSIRLEQMGDTNVIAMRIESTNASAITRIVLDLTSSASKASIAGFIAERENGPWKLSSSEVLRAWDPFIHEEGTAVIMRLHVAADKLAEPMVASVTVTTPAGPQKAILTMPALTAREFGTEFTHIPIAGSRTPLMAAYNPPAVDFMGVGERIAECSSGACDAIVVYNTFADSIPFYVSGMGNMQANGIGRGDAASQPFVPNYIHMGARLNGRDDSFLLSHEFGHGWLYGFSIIENGQKTHSLNPDYGHPATYVHAPVAFPQTPGVPEASTMGGGVWQQNSDGSFTSLSEHILLGYSWLELYLMGLAAPSEVSDWFYIRDTNPPQPDRYSAWPGVRVNGTKVPVNINQVIAAEGPRVPSYSTSKKDFTVQFVLLHRRGETITPEQVSDMHEQRLQWQEKWQRAVGGRARLRTSVVPTVTSNGPAVRLEVYSGKSQFTLWGFYLEYPLVAVATDALGRPVPGVNVTWSVARGQAILHPSGPRTDEAGRAVTRVELQSSYAEITASTADGLSAVFTARTGPLEARIASGDRQTAVVGFPLPQPIVVEVRDQSGMPLAGIPVQFSGNAGGLTTSTITDASGLAKTWATPTAPGPILIFADVRFARVLSFAGTGIEAGGRLPLAVVSSASFQCCNLVAPGQIVSIWGSGFGAPDLTLATYDSENNLPRTVGGTRVLFDGVAAPMIFSLSGQVSAVVPYRVTGTTHIQVEQDGRIVNEVEAAVVYAAPGIFCYAGGKGQAVAVNTYSDGRAAFNKDEPAQRGSWLTFFMTGEGEQWPAWTDGHLPVYPNNPRPGQLRIFIGDVESNCVDNWVGLVYAGVTQVNACVPAGAPVGSAVPLRVVVGPIQQSQPEVTVSVQ